MPTTLYAHPRASVSSPENETLSTGISLAIIPLVMILVSLLLAAYSTQAGDAIRAALSIP